MLTSLAGQEDVDWELAEIIVVDNNCTDDTEAIVASFSERISIRRVTEGKQGLSHARNRALACASGRWVIFTDDDVILESYWLRSYMQALLFDDDYGYAGGRILPKWVGSPPRWFKGERLSLLDGVMVWFDLGPERRGLALKEPLPFGASFAIRRALFERIGPFRADLGVKGTVQGRGEETEWMMRARRWGAKGCYVGDAVCWHSIEAKRFKLSALYSYGLASGKAHRAIVDSYATGSNFMAAAFFARGLIQLAKGRGDRFRQCIINAGVQRSLAKRDA